ncbi:PIR Superfamily Protein [Plasmodium ovale curtisi]|uniref:PIR Superfamily Protein n=1 Tax=Plasmodium ovale curtisi TaxID=864141 RepID=A0A1A8WBU9_PLAOA|nr:PIR Superfamily Protein [Plasmodium ovale curtisi]
MAKGSSHAGPRRLSETYSIDLLSKKIYDHMEINHLDLSHYDEKCNITFSSKNNDQVKEICKKTLSYLEKSDVWDIPNSRYSSCILLNYWIYDKLNHILGDKYTSDVAFGSLQLPWNYPMNNRSNIAYSNKCKDNFGMLNHDDWKKRKELYDYYVDIETLLSTANNYVDQCKYYYEYIEKKKELFKYFDDLFISDQSKCPEFYYQCKDYNPKEVLPKLQCHNQIVQERAASEISQKARVQAPDPKLSGIEGDSPSKEMALENSQIGTKIGHSLLGIAPVFLTASALYRYTPVGSWVRKLGGYDTNSIRDMDAGEMNEFLGNTQESGDILFDSSENYISYQPM